MHNNLIKIEPDFIFEKDNIVGNILSIFDKYDSGYIPLLNLEELMEPVYQILFIEYCDKLERNRFLPFNLY